MDWAPLLLRLGAALPYLAGFVVVVGVATVAVVAMVAVWHPDARRRTAAFRVLRLLAGVVRGGDR